MIYLWNGVALSSLLWGARVLLGSRTQPSEWKASNSIPSKGKHNPHSLSRSPPQRCILVTMLLPRPGKGRLEKTAWSLFKGEKNGEQEDLDGGIICERVVTDKTIANKVFDGGLHSRWCLLFILSTGCTFLLSVMAHKALGLPHSCQYFLQVMWNELLCQRSPLN